MIGQPASSKRFCQYGSRAMKTGMQFTIATPGFQDLLGVPLGRGLGADGEVVDDDVRAGVLQDLHHVVRLSGRLLDDLREVLADAVVRHAAGDLDSGLRHVRELDRVVGMRPDGVGEIDADLALHDVERGCELDVRDVIAAEVDVHESGHGVLGLRVLVVLDSLQERVGAVAHADDRDAHLVLRARAVLRAVRRGHECPSLSIAPSRDAETVGERGEDDVVRVGVAPRRLRMDLVLQLLRDAEEQHGAAAGEHLAAAAGRGVGDVELVGEDAGGDVVDVGVPTRSLADERLLQRSGHPDQDARSSSLKC